MPGADVVEHLEAGLRPTPGPTLSERLDEIEAAPRRPRGRAVRDTSRRDRPRRSRRSRRRGVAHVPGHRCPRRATASASRRCWPRRASGAAEPARTSSTRRRVRVNGEVAVLGRRVDPEVDVVEVDGAQIGVKPGLVHYLLNKPAGVISTASDPQGRPTVVDLVPAEPRVFPVGRLDGDSEGLLLLTNDGDLTHRLTHPSFGVDKEYLVEVDGDPSPRRAGAAARRDRARRRPHRAGQGRPARRAPAADHDPRGTQPSGPAHVRGGRPSRSSAWSARASARSPTAR